MGIRLTGQYPAFPFASVPADSQAYGYFLKFPAKLPELP